jgi:hypothetical protein
MALDRYIWRRGQTFHFRRRLDFRIGESNPISISMKTRDPDRARILARRLASRWDMEMTMLGQSFTQPMSASQRSQIFKMAMVEELTLASAHSLDRATFNDAEEKRRARIYAAAYDEERQRYVRGSAPTLWDSLDEDDRKIAEKFHSVYVSRQATERRIMPDYVEKLGIGVSEANLFDAIKTHYSGLIEGQQRSAFLAHPEVKARGDLTTALLDDDLIASLRLAENDTLPTKAMVPAPAQLQQIDSEFPFKRRDERRFSEVLPEIIKKKRENKTWSIDKGDQNRVLSIFCWITGDKQLCDYRQTDIEAFEEAYARAPLGFRWMKHIKDPSRPTWEEIKAGFPKKPSATRKAGTYNRDVGILQSACRMLGAKGGAWEPKSGKSLALEVEERKAVEQINPLNPNRMPWTAQQLTTLFSLFLYIGGGGKLRRLKSSHMPRVWHDAAYWVPLLAAYSGAAREELCGLEVADVVLDCAVPHIWIRANMARSKDGQEKAGLKAAARYRHVPIHPELRRLGFEAYVREIAKKRHKHLFPELFDIERGGGTKFYARAWQHIADAVDAVTPLYRTASGKRADFHSIRTYSESVLSHVYANQASIDRILGHVTVGTGGQNYNRRQLVIGIEAYLKELLELMVQSFPNVTAHLKPSPIALLPLADRSRTGRA